MLTEDEKLGLMMDKLLNDGTYGINTHFNAMGEELAALRKQIQMQNRVIKELWVWKKSFVPVS